MAKKIYLSPSSQLTNKYATGNTNEQEQCRKISDACAAYLIKAGFEVKNAKYGDMYSRVDESNRWGADLHVPIHTNAFDGTITGGTQIYLLTVKEDSKHEQVGSAIFKELSPLTPGKSHEGLKPNESFYEIKKANALTVYMECEFHDTYTGAKFIINNVKAIGEAIAKGICKYYGVALPTETPKKENNTSSSDGALYVVRAGAFKDKANADKRVADLKKAGFDAYVKKE